MPNIGQQFLTKCRMLAPHWMLRLWNTEAALIAQGKINESRHNHARQQRWEFHFSCKERRPSVDGNPHHVFRHHVSAGARRERYALRALAQIDRDIDRRISNANHKDILVVERPGSIVLAGMNLGAAKMPRKRGPA